MSDTTTALVTGGTRGIGHACVTRLAAEGHQVYFTYVSKPELAKQVEDEVAAAGGTAKGFLLDSSDRDAVREFFKEHIKKQVTLGVLVNNAGITRDGLMIRMKDEDWDTVININLTGAFTMMAEAAKVMSKQRQGRIVNIASIVGQMGNAGQANYVAAKAGLIGATKTAARELASRSVTANAIAPGFIQTDMTDALPDNVREHMMGQIPAGRFGTVEDIAGAVAFLAGPDAAYITGQVLGVNGGMYM